MKRLRNWQSRLAACLAERRARPFVWGELDCCLFAADCVLACTGEDLAANYRGTYSDASSAARLLEAEGGLQAIAEKSLGREIPTSLAQPGDIGLLVNDGRPCLAVCSGYGWIAPGGEGLINLPMAHALTAWRLIKDRE